MAATGFPHQLVLQHCIASCGGLIGTAFTHLTPQALLPCSQMLLRIRPKTHPRNSHQAQAPSMQHMPPPAHHPPTSCLHFGQPAHHRQSSLLSSTTTSASLSAASAVSLPYLPWSATSLHTASPTGKPWQRHISPFEHMQQQLRGYCVRNSTTNGWYASTAKDPRQQAPPEPPRQVTDAIHIRSARFYGYHGVLPAENAVGQPFIVDASLYLDLRGAGRTDDLHMTVSYADVFQCIQQVMEGPPHALLESLAHHIAGQILVNHSLIQGVRLSISKAHIPKLSAAVESVGVEVLRTRADFPATPPSPAPTRPPSSSP